MRFWYTFIFCLFSFHQIQAQSNTDMIENSTITQSFYDFQMTSLDGKSQIDFSDFKGKKVLLINVASKCGYTPQYADIQKFYEEYGDKMIVLGFPANNFGAQEPGTNNEIAQFCHQNFGVTFQMFEKLSVKGDDQHPLYTWLSEKAGQEPSWNFCKYLVDENGEIVKFFASGVNPYDDAILEEVQ